MVERQPRAEYTLVDLIIGLIAFAADREGDLLIVLVGQLAVHIREQARDLGDAIVPTVIAVGREHVLEQTAEPLLGLDHAAPLMRPMRQQRQGCTVIVRTAANRLDQPCFVERPGAVRAIAGGIRLADRAGVQIVEQIDRRAFAGG